MKKKHGWILEDTIVEIITFVDENFCNVHDIREAKVFATRKAARESTMLTGDVIRKVSLSNSGKTINIIPGR